MEAVETENNQSKQDSQVVEVRSKGYKLNGKVIKFAKVVVG